MPTSDPLPEDPPCLYHYTTTSGLIGIITSKTFWATEARFLNDHAEISYMERILTEALTDLEPLIPDPSPAQRQAITMCEVAAHMPAPISGIPSLALFFVSFCESPDLLSQWRAYGSGRGFAIGFNRANLLAVEGLLRKVSYNRTEQVQTLRSEVLARVNGWDYADPPEDDPNVIPGASDFVASVRASLAVNTMYFKQAAFEEEQEWRITVISDADEEPRLQFRSSPLLGVVPYIPIDLAPAWESLVQEILIGPTPYPSEAQRAVSMLLRRSGLNPANVTLRTSSASLRT